MDTKGGESEASFLLSILTIDLLHASLDDKIAVDTGIKENLIILANGGSVQSMTLEPRILGTAY